MSYVLAQTRLDAVLDNRPATAVGLLGTALCGVLATLLAHASAGTAGSHDEGLDELPFLPGMVLALGSPDAEARVADPGVAPPSPPVEPATPDATPEADAAEDPPTADEAVTDEITPPAARPRPRPEPSQPHAGPSLPSHLPAPPSLPGPIGTPSKGDPFGDPNGLDDLASAGDPWARGVIAAIEAMDVGTPYAKPIEGNVRFQLTICKDGTVSRVAYKGGTASVDERDLVILELGRLSIPRPPADIAAQMRGSCAKLGHTFSWKVDGTR
jgi:hypothetical protein